MTDHALGPRFTRLWLATALSNMADGALVVGAPLLAVALTRSPLLVALTSTLAMVPWLVVPLLAGALADRHDRRRIIIAAAWLRAALLAAAAAAAAAGGVSIAVLYVLVLLVGACEVFADTTTQSMLPMLVARERLDAANGRIISAQKVTAELLGSPVAGALVAVGGAALFGATAMLYAVVGMVLASMSGNYTAEHSDASTTTLLSEVAEGVRYLRANSTIRALALLAGLLNLAASAYLAVFVLWAVGTDSAMGLQPASYGLLLALAGVGGAAGALTVEPITERLGEVPVLLGSAVAAALLLLIPVVAPTIAAVGPALFAVGVASAATNVVIVSMRQRLIPDPLLGRVNATYRLIGMGTMPIGALLGGLVAEHTAVGPVLVGSSVLSILAIVAARRHVTPTAVAQAQREAALQ